MGHKLSLPYSRLQFFGDIASVIIDMEGGESVAPQLALATSVLTVLCVSQMASCGSWRRR